MPKAANALDKSQVLSNFQNVFEARQEEAFIQT